MFHCHGMRQNQQMILKNETSEKEEQVSVVFWMLSKKGTASLKMLQRVVFLDSTKKREIQNDLEK